MSTNPKISSPQTESLEKLKALIGDIEIASLVTTESDGTLRSRPMGVQPMGDEAVLWFFTNDYTAKVDDVRVHPQVCVIYADAGAKRFVSVSGTAELVRDAEKIRQLWTPNLDAWFPHGTQDPDLALLRLDIVSAQSWDAPTSKLVHIFALLKAAATGQAADVGGNEKLTVKERIGSDTAT